MAAAAIAANAAVAINGEQPLGRMCLWKHSCAYLGCAIRVRSQSQQRKATRFLISIPNMEINESFIAVDRTL